MAVAVVTASVPFCDALWLPRIGCPVSESGVTWSDFLRLTCAHCRPDWPCAEEPSSEALLATALRIVHFETVQCVHGVLAALIVVAQFFDDREMTHTPELAEPLTTLESLSPFPFFSRQFSLYANMDRIKHPCNVAALPAMANTFVPKTKPSPGKICGMTYGDSQLIFRCRSRLKSHERIRLQGDTERLREISCPSWQPSLSNEDPLTRQLKTFHGRAESQRCQDPRGMWLNALSDVHRCVVVTVGILLGFKPGDLLLDWGSGCGHKLSWAKALFDVDGLGVEITQPAVQWARRHSVGTFCHADGRNLSWIPDETFDFVFSYGALYLLPDAEQCATGLQLAQKLRVGGKAFFGWNRVDSTSNVAWRTCFGDLDRRAEKSWVEVEEMEDAYLFPPDENIGSTDGSYRWPIYSIFLTRLK